MKMIRACIVGKYIYPDDTRTRQQAEALEQAGFVVDILCLRGKGQEKVERFGLVTAYRVLEEKPRDSFVKYLRVTLCFLTAAFLKLQRLSLKKTYDIIVVHTLPEFLIFVGTVQKILGKPLILDVRDLSVELFKSKWGRWGVSIILMPLAKVAEKLSCRFANHLIVASPGFKRRLVERGASPEKTTLLFNTADSQIFKYQSDRKFYRITKGARLIYHGTVAERFGLTNAIEVVARLQALVPESTLEIYGLYSDSSYRAECEKKIRQLGLTNRIFLHERRSLEEIFEIIRDADIGVVPYLNDDFMNLALSTKIFEYTASGLPVVASRLQSLTSIFDNTCILFADPGNPQDFAEKIAELCLDPELRKARVKCALEEVGKISGDVMAERYRKLVIVQVENNGTCRS